MTSIGLVNQCFKICLWFPLTVVKSLPLNSAIAYASSVKIEFLNSFTFCGFRLQILRVSLTFADSSYVLRNLCLLAMFACFGIRNKIIMPTKFTLQVYVRGIHVNRIYLHFGTCLNTCIWNQGTYRHKIVRLSSAQFELVTKFKKNRY